MERHISRDPLPGNVFTDPLPLEFVTVKFFESEVAVAGQGCLEPCPSNAGPFCARPSSSSLIYKVETLSVSPGPIKEEPALLIPSEHRRTQPISRGSFREPVAGQMWRFF
jgi:hypothetical protein